MILISVHIPEIYLDELQKLCEEGYFPNRAEAIRAAIRDMLKLEYYKRNEERMREMRAKLGLDY